MLPNDLEAKLNEWKDDSRTARIRLECVQDGLSNLSWAVVESFEVKAAITFCFGREYASGQIVIPLSPDLSIELITDPRSQLPQQYSLLGAPKECVRLTWNNLAPRERFLVFGVRGPKIGKSMTTTLPHYFQTQLLDRRPAAMLNVRLPFASG